MGKIEAKYAINDHLTPSSIKQTIIAKLATAGTAYVKYGKYATSIITVATAAISPQKTTFFVLFILATPDKVSAHTFTTTVRAN